MRSFSSSILMLAGLSGLLTLLFFIAQSLGVGSIFMPTVYLSVGFFFILFSIVHFALVFSKISNEQFVSTTILMMVLKLVFSLLLVVAFSFLFREVLVVSTVQFCIIYLIFTTFDVFVLAQFLSGSVDRD